MTDFIVERVNEPIRAWEYDGTGRATWSEDRSTWPAWLQKETSRLRFSNGGLLFFHRHGRADGRQIVHKGEFLVLDAGELLHFDSKAAFNRRYVPVTSTGKNPGEKT
jgi:hypothetical protein